MKRSSKQHFGSQDWVDFVNGTASEAQQSRMQKHLSDGCKTCFNAADLWTRVQEHAKREGNFEVPASGVRHVLNAFRVTFEGKKAERRLQIPRLVFDSLWQPALAGVRAVTAAPRQVVYKSGDAAVELRVEPEPLSERWNVTGQIYCTVTGTEGLAQMPVLVMSQSGILAETHTTDFGEFQMSFVPATGLRLVFGLDEGVDLSIPLDTNGVAISGRS